jgi:membrane protein
VWIYVAWVVVLLGAVLAAYLPSLVAGTRRRSGHGWQFQVALEVLRELETARHTPTRGLSAPQLSLRLELETLQLEPVLEALVALDWIGRLNEVDDAADTRYVLLADARTTALEPLMRVLLLPPSAATHKLWSSGQLASLRLHDVI